MGVYERSRRVTFFTQAVQWDMRDDAGSHHQEHIRLAFRRITAVSEKSVPSCDVPITYVISIRNGKKNNLADSLHRSMFVAIASGATP